MVPLTLLEKPLSLTSHHPCEDALKIESLRRENRETQESVFIEDSMVGESEAMKQVRERIAMSAGSDAKILILGENGTGKELVAREITSSEQTRPRALCGGELRCNTGHPYRK
jgi:two-component system nitrogen regulation response regulator NtrX